jgi:nitrate reductase NapAB chaperone NapD
VERADETSVKERLEALRGVSTFPLDVPGKVGLLIEAGSLDEAHAVLSRDIQTVEGVLGVWPVYAHSEAGAHSEVGIEAGDGGDPQGAEQ